MYPAAGFAQPAEEGGCAPLLTTKYEPDVVKTDRDIEVGNRVHKQTFIRVVGVSETPRR